MGCGAMEQIHVMALEDAQFTAEILVLYFLFVQTFVMKQVMFVKIDKTEPLVLMDCIAME